MKGWNAPKMAIKSGDDNERRLMTDAERVAICQAAYLEAVRMQAISERLTF